MSKDEKKGEEGMTWQDIVRLIGEILIIIAKGSSVDAACGGVAPTYGISAGVAKKLYDKYHKEVEK